MQHGDYNASYVSEQGGSEAVPSKLQPTNSGAVAQARLVLPVRAARATAVVLGLIVAAALAGCRAGGVASLAHAVEPPASANRVGPAAAWAANSVSASFAITPEVARHLRIDRIEVGDLTETLHLPGRLNRNANRTARVGSPVAGRVTKVHATLGQLVHEGETMAELSSPELAAAQLSFLKAAAEERLQMRAVERAELLLEADVIGAAELQRRQNEFAVAQAERRAAADQLRSVGFSASLLAMVEQTGTVISTLPIVAPRTGTVVERQVLEGQAMQPADTLFTVTDLTSVWAVADVPEHEADAIRTGQPVEVQVPALEMDPIRGKIVYIADQVNAETRTVRIGVDISNTQRRLKPEMLITMRIEANRARGPLVPASAVVRENGRDHLFAVSQDNHAKLVPVELGAESNGQRAIKSALDKDSRIVVDGAFQLNSERLRQQP